MSVALQKLVKNVSEMFFVIIQASQNFLLNRENSREGDFFFFEKCFMLDATALDRFKGVLF